LEKKIVLTIFALVCLLTTTLVAQLELGVGEEGYYDRYEPWEISGTLILEWDLYPWHTVRFWDCNGFNITANNTLLDLNGHRAMFNQTVLGPGPTGIILEGKSRVTIRNGTIIGFQYGIWVKDSSEVNMAFNSVSASTRQGIGICNSKDVNMAFNSVSGSGYVGIGLDKSSFDVSILNNSVSGSGDVNIGIYDNSFDVSILNNTVTNSGREGIHLTYSNHNIVSGNKISENLQYGIWLYNSNNNTIDSNTLFNNKPGGIYMEMANQNIIYHNNFIDNEKHVTNVGSTNSWDVGYGTIKDAGYGGNYWDDYEGIDEYSGADKNVPGSDGMGDTPYVIDANNRDNYPLMDPWGSMLTELKVPWEKYNITCYIAVFSNSSIADLSFNRAEVEISFTTSNGTFCKVIVPKDALDGSFNVSIDDVTTACILNWDKTHHFINFAFNNQPHSVKITGEIAIRGDLNGDGKVNIHDLYIIAKNYGKEL